MTSYWVRRLTPEDAEGIPALAERVNGSNYAHREVFHPTELLRLNREGRLISVVAQRGATTYVFNPELDAPTVVLEVGVSF